VSRRRAFLQGLSVTFGGMKAVWRNGLTTEAGALGGLIGPKGGGRGRKATGFNVHNGHIPADLGRDSPGGEGKADAGTPTNVIESRGVARTFKKSAPVLRPELLWTTTDRMPSHGGGGLADRPVRSPAYEREEREITTGSRSSQRTFAPWRVQLEQRIARCRREQPPHRDRASNARDRAEALLWTSRRGQNGRSPGSKSLIRASGCDTRSPSPTSNDMKVVMEIGEKIAVWTRRED